MPPPLRRALAFCLFLAGLLLIFRLLLAAIPPLPAIPSPVTLATRRPQTQPPARTVATGPAATEDAPTATAGRSPAAVPVEAVAFTATAQSSPAPTAASEATTPPGAAPTGPPSAPAAATAAAPTTATAGATAATAAAPTTAASPTFQPRIVDNGIEPPWWPCAEGEVKGLAKLRSFYPPDHPGYRRVYAGVACFPDVAAARAAGYQEAPRQ